MTEHVDMSHFVEAKSDQLNADDLIGSPRTITITAVRGCDGDQPIAISYNGDGGKPFKPCKTIRRVLLAIWGRNASDYVGRSMTLYRDDSVTFGGLNVGGIRISHMSHLEKETVVVVMKTKGKKAGIKVLPLKDAPATSTKTDFNAVLADLKQVAQPGNLDALGAAWKEIGPEARKALAAELPALKAACAVQTDDVPFDAETGEITEPETPAPDRPETDPPGVNDAHPAQLKADAIMAEIRAMPDSSAVLDVNALLSRHAGDIDAMPETMQREIEAVAQEKRDACRAEQAKTKEAVA